MLISFQSQINSKMIFIDCLILLMCYHLRMLAYNMFVLIYTMKVGKCISNLLCYLNLQINL